MQPMCMQVARIGQVVCLRVSGNLNQVCCQSWWQNIMEWSENWWMKCRVAVEELCIPLALSLCPVLRKCHVNM